MSVSDIARSPLGPRAPAPEPNAAPLGPRPPAPEPNAARLGSLAFLIRFWQNPIATWTRQDFELPIIQAKGVHGPVALVSEPAAIRRIYIDNVANYTKDALQRYMLSPGPVDGLITAEGEDWRAQRRALAPLFTPRMVKTFAPAMIESGQWLLDRWLPLREGRRVDVASEMALATLDVLQRAIFPAGLARDPDAFAKAVHDFFNSRARRHLHPFDLLGAPAWLPRVGKPSSAPQRRCFNRAIGDTLREARQAVAQSGGASRDLLTMMLNARDPQTGEGLDEARIRANVMTFMGAGYETTYSNLTWSLFLLSQHPDWRESVEREVDEVLGLEAFAPEMIDRLPRVRATIEEALRLYPPVPRLSRSAIAADVLVGQPILPGTLVVVAPYVLHRHRALWSDPDWFDPNRFMPGRREAIDRFAFLPFGAGPHTCIGMSFGVQQAIIFLAMILRVYRLDLVAGHRVTPVQRLTLRPKEGMPMLLRRRHGG